MNQIMSDHGFFQPSLGRQIFHGTLFEAVFIKMDLLKKSIGARLNYKSCAIIIEKIVAALQI